MREIPKPAIKKKELWIIGKLEDLLLIYFLFELHKTRFVFH